MSIPQYDRTAYPTITTPMPVNEIGEPTAYADFPLLFLCPSESHDDGWQDAIVDVTEQEQGDYAFLLRCGHTFVGYVEDH